ncbi:DUF1236 domain-containing protein [Rhizobium sp. RU36D]|uniref:DUF1236 domain-containing protein n=1 Tax=Rhizobium sp. RU36D TaxID=1907415 RepID=UPI0009D7F741|nr:DUF1236 domain-containing protein [Rhizobium sp. RU36D]SMD09131.1 Protein of unknown function [Rhizobium sp. RU36D]
MRKPLTLTLAAVLGLSATAFAQDTIIVRDPTVTGSVVVGAPPPPAVRTYILEQRAPSVVYEGEVVVGAPLPQAVELYPVAEHDGYAYTIVNERRVLVDPQTREIIEVIN